MLLVLNEYVGKPDAQPHQKPHPQSGERMKPGRKPRGSHKKATSPVGTTERPHAPHAIPKGQNEPSPRLAIPATWDMLFAISHYLRKLKLGDSIGHPYGMTTKRKLPQGARSQDLRFTVETELETDGRWIAEIPQVPGAMAYGTTEEEAINKAYAIALRSVADDVEHSQQQPPNSISLERHIA